MSRPPASVHEHASQEAERKVTAGAASGTDTCTAHVSVRAKILAPAARISPLRRDASARASRLVREAIGKTTSVRNVAAALDVNHSAVVRFGDDSHASAITLRDLIAVAERGERDFVLYIASALRSLCMPLVDEPPPPQSRSLATIVSALGPAGTIAIASDADGVNDEIEERAFCDALRDAEEVVHAERVRRERRR